MSSVATSVARLVRSTRVTRLSLLGCRHCSGSRGVVHDSEVRGLLGEQFLPVAPSASTSAVAKAAAAPPPESLRPLLSRLAAHKQSDTAWRLYDELLARGASLDAVAYVGFIRAVGSAKSAGLARRALKIEADMAAAGLRDEADAKQLEAVVRASANAGDLARAEAAYAKLRRPVAPALTVALIRASAGARALELYRELDAALMAKGAAAAALWDPSGSLSWERWRGLRRAEGLEAAMAACAKAAELSRVEELEAEGRAAGLPLGKQTLQATLMACRAVGDAASAVRAYRQWQRRADVADADAGAGAGASFRPDQVSLKLLLDCVAREPPPKRGAVLGDVLELYDAAVANGEEPDTLTTNTLIRVCVTSGRPERAFAEFERNEARGARPPNLVVLQTLARGCQDASEAARDDHEAAEWMERCFDVYLAGKRLVAERKANFPRSGTR